MQAVKQLENLKHLAINNCSGISICTLKAIGEHCKSLNELEIEGILFCAEEADALHLTKLVNLKILKFTYNSIVTDEFLINLAQQCQQLIYLDITGKHNYYIIYCLLSFYFCIIYPTRFSQCD